MKKRSSLLLALLLIVLCVPGPEARSLSAGFETTILFTHDLHSHRVRRTAGSPAAMPG